MTVLVPLTIDEETVWINPLTVARISGGGGTVWIWTTYDSEAFMVRVPKGATSDDYTRQVVDAINTGLQEVRRRTDQ